MRIAFLGDASNIHTVRWVNGLAARDVEVFLVSAHKLRHVLDPRVVFRPLPVGAPLGYLANWMVVRRLLERIQPDLLNAHYATGYGLLARLCGFKPLLVSVWGSDVYEFPNKSSLHRFVLRGNLRAASAVASTSHCMAREAAKTYPHSKVFVTPFGIDEEKFRPGKGVRSDKEVVIGTVKTLASKYGVDTLIEAFARLKLIVPEANLRLEVSGGGPDRGKLEALAERLGIASAVTFHGKVAHDRVPEMLSRLDVYVALSRHESFGVAILEASATGLPVVVSDADGPVEVTVEGGTGFIVPRDDPDAAADAMAKLVLSSELRSSMGQAGRRHVLANYTWSGSTDTMLGAYKELLT